MSDGNPFVAFFNEHADFGVAYGRTFEYLDDMGAAIDTSAMVGHLTIRYDYSTPVLLALTAPGHVDSHVAFTAAGTQMEFAPEAESASVQCVYDVVLYASGLSVVKLVRGSFTLHPTSAV